MSLEPEVPNGSREVQGEIVIRVCAHYPGIGWKRLGIERATKAFKGEVVIPEFAGNDVRIAHLRIVNANEIERLLQLSITTWPFGGDGRIDSEAILKRMSAKMDGAPDPYTLIGEQIAEADREQIKALFNLQ